MIRTPDRPPREPETTNPILWGAYLACSWTWCIGMFLPAILLRDHGWTGLAVFALPNCIGAAAMGWVMRTPESSRRFAERHPVALRSFSIITIGFHVFWIAWIMPILRDALPMPDAYLFGAGATGVAFAIVSGRAVRAGAAPRLGAALLVLSLAVLGALLATGQGADANAALARRADPSAMTWALAPIACFGFFLCPFLDPTFHHARTHLPSRGSARAAFSVGFLVFFALMIVLTTRYAGVMVGALEGAVFTPIDSPLIASGVLAHILCQWVFTVRVHLNRLGAAPGADPARVRTLFGVALVCAMLAILSPRIPDISGLSAGEVGYRSFLWFYGLVFPSLVLYLVVRRRAHRVPLQRALMVAAIAVATPMFWMGFIERSHFWLVPGVVVACAGAFVLRAAPRENDAGGPARQG